MLKSTVDGVTTFHYEGWIGTNRNEGIFINFKDGEGNYWCPTEINFEDSYVKLHTIATGEEATDLVNKGATEYSGYAVTAPTNMIAIDVEMTTESSKVTFTNKAPEYAGDYVYLTAEKYDWSRDPDAAHTLTKISDGVYEGTVTVTREDAYFDMVRLYTKKNNGDNDNYIGFNNQGRKTTYAANGTYKLSTRPAGDFRMRRGKTTIRVNLNNGEVTFNYLGDKSYVYAVGNIEGHKWARDYYKAQLWETKAGSLIYKGIITIADEDTHEVTFFEEGSEGQSWSAGRFGPYDAVNKTNKVAASPKGEWYNGLYRWGDYAWKDIPAGTYEMTLDLVNDRFMYDRLDLSETTDNSAALGNYLVNAAPVVTVARTFTEGKWNTFSLPFSITLDEATAIFGAESIVAELSQDAGTYLDFTTVTSGSLEAGKPYLVYVPGTVGSELTFTEKKMVNTTGYSKQGSTTFHATSVAPVKVGTDAWYLTTNNTLKRNADAEAEVKAFRGYFTFSDAAAAKVVRIDGVATGIGEIQGSELIMHSEVYTLNGMKVAPENLQKGVYIVNGKKVIVK